MSAAHSLISETYRFLGAVAEMLGQAAGDARQNAGLERCRQALLAATVELAERPQRLQPPAAVRTWFDLAMTQAKSDSAQAADVISAIESLLPCADWIKRTAAPGQDEHFVEHHRHAMLLGPDAVLRCQTLSIGVAVMAPQVTYPFHQHPPEEFYIVLGEGDWYQEGRGWWSPGNGGMLYNEPAIRHAMKSTDKPLLALWGLVL